MEIRDAPRLVNVVRMDTVPLRKAYYTEEGYLRDRPILTSVGIFEYMNRDGTIRRELRLPEEVFDADSLASYLGAPIVITHDAGLIDKDNVAENQIGTILSKGEQDGADVRADIIIHDTDELKHSRMKELSLGYNLDLEETPGTWQGEHYDAIQRNIRINHLAVVQDARAGEQARLNLDSREKKSGKEGGMKMSKELKRARRLDAVLTDEQLEQALAEYRKNHPEAAQADADDEVEDTPAVVEEAGAAVAEEAPADDDVEGRVAAVKERRDRRDEQGDPKDMDEAMGNIAHQDEDIQTLIDIIDTLLAKGDFAAAGATEEVAQDEVDDLEKLKGDEDDVDETLEEETDPTEAVEDETAEDEVVEDTAEEGDLEDDEEDDLVTDEDDVLEDDEAVEDEEEEDEFAEDSCDDETSGSRMDAASIDRLVSQKIMLDELGRSIGLKGLAHKSVSDAKRAIIRKVRPEMRLDGKSDVYIDAAFDFAKKEIKANRKKNTATQKRSMFNTDYAKTCMDSDDAGGAAAHRQQMIDRQTNRKNQ